MMTYGLIKIDNTYDADKCIDFAIVDEEHKGEKSTLCWMKEVREDGTIDNRLMQSLGDGDYCVDVLKPENSFDEAQYNGKILKLSNDGKLTSVYVKSDNGQFRPFYKAERENKNANPLIMSILKSKSNNNSN